MTDETDPGDDRAPKQKPRSRLPPEHDPALLAFKPVDEALRDAERLRLENDPASLAFKQVEEALRDPVFAQLLERDQDAETDMPELVPPPRLPKAGRPLLSIVARAEAAKLRTRSAIGTRGPQLQPRQELTSSPPVKDTGAKIEPPSDVTPSLRPQFDVNWGQGSGVLFLLTTFGTGIGLATAMSPHRLEWVVALIVLLAGAAVTGWARPTLARHTNTAMVALAIMLVLALLPI